MNEQHQQKRIEDLEEERDQLLQVLEDLAINDRSPQEHNEQCLAGRVYRNGNSLIMNLEELNRSTSTFFAELEHYPEPTRRAVLRLLKQHHDLLVNQFKTFNLHL